MKKRSGSTRNRIFPWRYRIFVLVLFSVIIDRNAPGQPVNDLLDRQISLSVTQGTVQSILDELVQDHKINLSYDPGIIPWEKRVELDSQPQTLGRLLTLIFRDTGIKHTPFGDQIILGRLKKYTVSGYTEDAETGERLIGATLFDYVSKKGTITNNYGFFSLTIIEGSVSLHASFVGYKSAASSFILGKDTTMIIKLDPGVEIEAVAIMAKDPKENVISSRISVENISMKSFDRLPSLLGEGDIMKLMQFLPGIQFGTETSSGLIVRGGSPEQNLILLDGAPVYNSNHAFGLFSVFNSDAIKNLILIKGGFPARYGGRLSSVMDVRMKEGNMKEYHGSVNLGLIASKFTLEGPVIKDKSSFIISARRTYVDLYLPESGKTDSDIPGFYFYDINSKLNYKFSQKDRVFLSFYLGNDKFYEEEKYTEEYGTYSEIENTEADWGNRTALIRWNHLYTNKLFSNFSVLFSKYELQIKDDEEERLDSEYKFHSFKYNSGIKDVSLKLDFDFYPAASHKIKFGADYIYHTFNPGELRKISEEYFYSDGVKITIPTGNIDENSCNNPIYANEFRAFIEDDFSVKERFFTNMGLHYSGFLVNGSYYSSLEPRISATWPISGNLSVKGAYSRMKQYIHLLTHSSMGLPTDLWLPVTSSVKPQYSNQYTTGLVYHINEMLELNTEVYYKTLHQIYAYREGVDYLSANNTWESNIVLGHGKSYGIESIIRKHSGRLEGWLTYTYSRTTRQFEEVNYGKEFPYKYDRTHQVNAVVTYALNKRFSVNATWLYATGMAYTLSTEKYISLYNLYNWNAPDNPSGYIDAYDTRNNARMPDYHRLDIALNYSRQKKKTTRTWNLSVYNVYNRFNPYLIYWEEDMSDYSKRKLKQVALFSVIPSLSYRIEF